MFTLNMSMLKSFFEIGTDKSLFAGLYISKNKELCDEYMGKYPVIFLSLKGVEGLDFSSARRMLRTIIECEINRHYYLKTSDALTEEDRAQFAKMLQGNDSNIEDSIRMLSQLLYKHYRQKTVILIDAAVMYLTTILTVPTTSELYIECRYAFIKCTTDVAYWLSNVVSQPAYFLRSIHSVTPF